MRINEKNIGRSLRLSRERDEAKTVIIDGREVNPYKTIVFVIRDGSRETVYTLTRGEDGGSVRTQIKRDGKLEREFDREYIGEKMFSDKIRGLKRSFLASYKDDGMIKSQAKIKRESIRNQSNGKDEKKNQDR